MPSTMKQVSSVLLLLVTLVTLAWAVPSAAACEVAFPPNYLYEEQYSFDESHFPPGLSVDFTRPQWVQDEGLVGFLQLVNQGSADIYLLFSFELGNAVKSLSDGQKVDSSIWSRGLALRTGGTFDIVGEGNMMQFAPGLKGLNVNDIDGDAPSLNPPLAQSGHLYLVSNQQLSIVPFTVTYSDNPTYKPEGSFHPYTLAQKVESAPMIALGVTLQEAGYDSRAATTVQVEQWLKGTGESEITVTGFGNSSCDYQIEAGAQRVFFLAPDGDGYRLNGFQEGMFDAMTWPTDADDISAIIEQSSPVDSTEPSPLAAERPWIAAGLSMFLIVVGSALLLLRNQHGRPSK